MPAPYRLEIRKEGLFLQGRPFDLASGSIHYFRIHPTAWRQRLELARAFGLTAVETYAPWNLHEPREGRFDFDGLLDLPAFLREAEDLGLKVLLRPSPFINSECDLGGLPWWLLKRPRTELRCGEPAFLASVEAYYERLCERFVPLLSTRGGPVIAVAIENEYGGVGRDPDYLAFLRDCLTKNGVDVPFFTTDCNRACFFSGTLPGVWAAVNYRIESAEAIADLRRFQPELPALVGEYWSGRAGYWGTPFHPRDPGPIAKAYRTALDLNASVNFYMFCGGTNFGFFNGSKVLRPFDAAPDDPEKFHCITTSYDVNALVGEDGRPTEKYHACRRELAERRGLPVPTDPLPLPEAQAIGPVALTERAALFGQLSALSKPLCSSRPLTMEEADQGYGYMLYETRLSGPGFGPLPLHLDGLADRAVVYLDGKPLGAVFRGEDRPPLRIVVPEEGLTLSILVENCGRLSTSHGIHWERKGIREGVRLGGMRLYGWTMWPLPLSDLSGLRFAPESGPCGDAPAFYRGRFDAKPGLDTFLRTPGWHKGLAWVNGFLLGRYWDIGPQETLYVPGGLLKARDNELVLFENHAPAPSLRAECIDHALLDGPIQPY